MLDLINYDSLLTTLISGGSVLAVAKYLLTKSAEKMEKIPEDISIIKLELAKIEIHIGELARLKETVREHDRLLSILVAQNGRLRDDVIQGFSSSKNP